MACCTAGDELGEGGFGGFGCGVAFGFGRALAAFGGFAVGRRVVWLARLVWGGAGFVSFILALASLALLGLIFR